MLKGITDRELMDEKHEEKRGKSMRASRDVARCIQGRWPGAMTSKKRRAFLGSEAGKEFISK